MTILLLASCNSCQNFRPFDPAAPLSEKWERISPWISGSSPYIVVADLNKLAETDFFKEVFTNNADKNLQLFKAFNIQTDVGIVAFANDVMFIGGKFEPEAILQKIGETLKEDEAELQEDSYRHKKLYTSTDEPDSSFTFLEKYLIAFGNKDSLKKLIGDKGSGKPPAVDTSRIFWGHINDASKYYSKIGSLEFYADITSTMKVFAVASLASKEAAKSMVEELEGIKTIKTIQSVDEPWLADVLDEIKIDRDDSLVNVNAVIDQKTAKAMLKRGLK